MNATAVPLRLTLFAAFAAYGATHWAMLVAAPSATTILATVAAATGCAIALALLDRARLPRRTVQALSALAVLAALVAGLAITGIAPRLLLPSGWSELAADLDHALLGIQGVDWPYDGPDEWIRLTILLGAPLLLTAAAGLAFWPAPREMRPPLRGAALVLLIATYAIAATTNSPGSPLLFGTLLLALIAAWLWLPRRAVREWAAAGAVVAAVTLLALPAANALNGDGPWLDYRSWSPFGPDAGVAFSWDHSYGPLDWPRQGTTLLNVRADRPHYWKAETLNSFDGVRWYRATGDEQRDLSAELPFDRNPSFESGPWRYGRSNPDWYDEIQFTVRSLSTELLVGAGLTYDVDGAAAVPSADGTTQLLGRLERGDSYTVRTYQPSPTAIVMAGAPASYPDWVERYTELTLPEAGADGQTVVVPPRGNRATDSERAAVETALADSVYSRAYDLASGLTAGSASTYDAVAAIESHLRDSYRYSEDVPDHVYPLESFLFEDRQGYCQQFSGAMALMLRMVGIPARVAAGFSPGTLNRKTGEYRVRDLDAHSWVEVYFAGIGWVTFDPTPRATDSAPGGGAPASTGASAAAGDVQQSPIDPEPPPPSDANAPADAATDGGPTSQAPTESDSGGGLSTFVLLLAAALAAPSLASALVFAIRVRRRNALDREQLATAEIAELRHALDRLGWDVSPATTLLALEQRLATTAGPRAAAYARALRNCRFDPRGSKPPGPAERRALRRALASASGPFGPLRALIALPPG